MAGGSLAGPEIAPQNVGNGQSHYSSKKHQGETLQDSPAKVHLETDLTAVPNTVMIGFLSQEQSRGEHDGKKALSFEEVMDELDDGGPLGHRREEELSAMLEEEEFTSPVRLGDPQFDRRLLYATSFPLSI